jgi:hypothetical protein
VAGGWSGRRAGTPFRRSLEAPHPHCPLWTSRPGRHRLHREPTSQHIAAAVDHPDEHPERNTNPEARCPGDACCSKGKDKAGVEAFARYWIATLDFLVKTGDARPLQAASSTNCDWCNQLIKAYGDIYRAGGHLSGELDSRITIVHLVRLTDTNRGYVEFRVVAPAHTEVPSKGATPEQNKEAVLDFTLKETFSDRQWKISDAVWTTVESG